MKHPPIDRLLRKLASHGALSQDEIRAVHALPMRIVELSSGQTVVQEGDTPTRCAFLLDGFQFGSKTTGDGNRQIISVYVPGDMPDLQSIHLKKMDMTVAALGPCQVGYVSHDAIREICSTHTGLCFAFWRDTLVDAALYREWVTNVGQRGPDARAAHLFCEILFRLRAVGLTQDNAYPLPMTQQQLADALGLSLVHTSRTLRGLREKQLLEMGRSTVRILDLEGLIDLCDFDPTYLHLDEAVIAGRSPVGLIG